MTLPDNTCENITTDLLVSPSLSSSTLNSKSNILGAKILKLSSVNPALKTRIMRVKEQNVPLN